MKRIASVLATAVVMTCGVATPAHAVPAPAVAHDIRLVVPGYEDCEFRTTAFSMVAPQINGDGSAVVVEIGSFEVTGTGARCPLPFVPTVVEIYDRSPGLPTYYTSGAFSARQDVPYRTVPTVSDGEVAAPDRMAGVVSVEFRAPLLGVCLMDVWAVATVAAPIATAAPCPVVEP